MKKSLFIIAFIITSIASSQEIYVKTLKLMGSRFDLTVVAKDSTEGHNYINMAIDEISRIEKLISSWDKNSQTIILPKFRTGS